MVKLKFLLFRLENQGHHVQAHTLDVFWSWKNCFKSFEDKVNLHNCLFLSLYVIFLGITFDIPRDDRDCQVYFLWKKKDEDDIDEDNINLVKQ